MELKRASEGKGQSLTKASCLAVRASSSNKTRRYRAKIYVRVPERLVGPKSMKSTDEDILDMLESQSICLCSVQWRDVVLLLSKRKRAFRPTSTHGVDQGSSHSQHSEENPSYLGHDGESCIQNNVSV